MTADQQRVVVVGGGIAGMTAAISLANVGFSVILVEQSVKLGGHAAHWACMATDACAKCSACLVQDVRRQVARHPLVEPLTQAQVTAIDGSLGRFHLNLVPRADPDNGNGEAVFRLKDARRVDAGCVILATGFEPFDARQHPLLGYQQFRGVVTIQDLDEALRADDLSRFIGDQTSPLRVAFVQCVGSRDRLAGRDYCSQFCCRTTIRLVRRLRYLRPNTQVTVFYIDLQIMSKEFGAFFEEVRPQVRFVQGVPAEVVPGEAADTYRLYSVLPGSNKTDEFEFDRVVLAVGMVPTPQQTHLSETFGVPLNDVGYFGASATLDTSREGIVAIGGCVGPTDIQGSRKQALAAANRVVQLLSPTPSAHPAHDETALPTRVVTP